MTTRSRAPAPATRTPARPRSPAATDLAWLAERLIDRDYELCRLVWEHRVLTTQQAAQLAFASEVRAQVRLVALYRYGVLDRFRPPRIPTVRADGTAPYHYVLGPAGAAALAAEHGITPTQLGYRRDRVLAIAHSQRLGHQVGVNGVFASLAGYARRHAPAALLTWLGERDCVQRWGRLVRPDGFGRWRDQAGDESDFFLEYDTGTEPLERLVGKLEGYAKLAATSGLPTPVVFWLPSPAREANLRQLLGTPSIPVATATPASGQPAKEVWLPAGRRGPRRLLTASSLPASGRRPAGGPT